MARVKDLWWTAGTPRRKTAKHPDNGGNKDAKRWLAVWIAPDGSEKTKACATKEEARTYGARKEADVERGTYIDPKDARITVGDWCDRWLVGYSTRRPRTVRAARVHVAQIKAEFESDPLAAVRPSHVKNWCAKLKAAGAAPSYVFVLHGRLSQIMSDAVHDGILMRNPCSRRTSPGAGKQRPYVATTEQVWALYDAMPARRRLAVLLGAFAGLRVGEACGLQPDDVFDRQIFPARQYPAEPLKTEASQWPIPIPESLEDEIDDHVEEFPGPTVLTNDRGEQLAPWQIERDIRNVRGKIPGLPKGFRFQDLRHYFASLLIAKGGDVKAVSAAVRHAKASTTLDVYGHLWPDSDETTRVAVDDVLKARAELRQNQGGLI